MSKKVEFKSTDGGTIILPKDDITKVESNRDGNFIKDSNTKITTNDGSTYVTPESESKVKEKIK
jgi:hypothetical protein